MDIIIENEAIVLDGIGSTYFTISHGKWHAIIYLSLFAHLFFDRNCLIFISSSEIDQSFFHT